MIYLVIHRGWLGLLAAGCVVSSQAQLSTNSTHSQFGLQSVGGRFGVGGNSSSSDFQQADVFLDFSLPLELDMGKKWMAWIRLDSSAGWLSDSGDSAFIGSVGPTLVLARPPVPITLEAGVSPTVITHWEFATKDLGMPFQLTSHFGLNLELGRFFRLSYWYQHMSNGGFSPPNPGLNLHRFGFSHVF